MALPASGQIAMSQINAELGYPPISTDDSSFHARSLTAGFSVPDQFSDFYSFSTIGVYFGSMTVTTDNSTVYDAYTTVYHDDQSPTCNISIVLANYTSMSDVGGGTGTLTIYYRLNGGSWVSLTSRTTAGSGTVNNTISNVGYSDSVEVRLYMTLGAQTTGVVTSTIHSLAVYSGSGTLVIASPDSITKTKST